MTYPTRRPRFKDLPEYKDTGERHAWGVFGEGDELGTLNRLTPERALRGIHSVELGESYALSWDMDLPNPPFFTREPTRHTVLDLGEIHVGTDDLYDNYYSQSSSQWDALSHIGTPLGEFYNGFSEPDVHSSPEMRLSIKNVGERGIAGRYVLLDLGRYHDDLGHSLDLSTQHRITPSELDAVVAHQGVTIEEGDILLLRTGWLEYYDSLSAEEREGIGRRSKEFALEIPGLDSSREIAAWLWDSGIAAIAGDLPSLESSPFHFRDWDGFLHYRLIPLLGLTLGEFFRLGPLARACAVDKRYEGLIVAAPFNKHGGSGSPANALAMR